MKINRKNLIWLASAALTLQGCAGGDGTAEFVPSQPPTAPGVITFRANAEAGVPIAPSDSSTLVVAQSFSSRGNPFALRGAERAYEQSQLAANLVQIGGGWRFDYEPEEVRQPTFENEPQPYRRLAGILIGESVTALIDMGDGRGIQSIRPGQRIEGTEWIVASIDEEKAILRRIPGSTKRPSEVTVRLESPPFGGAAPTGGGAPAGGNPGGQPGSEGDEAPGGRGRRGGIGGGTADR